MPTKNGGVEPPRDRGQPKTEGFDGVGVDVGRFNYWYPHRYETRTRPGPRTPYRLS